MNTIMRSIVEQFNEEQRSEIAKIVGDDGDSFRIEFGDEGKIGKFQEFVKNATKKSILTEPMENIFGQTHLVRVFFEKSEAKKIIDMLKNYEEGTPLRQVECCGDGCNSHK
ncbi:MAG: hypothetical protein HY514_00040 [Candidatus Aenigmarchaeota archaeon]|nr:hypothetical protein [Candidatus Aenigmarchaeota archaeon]